MNLKVFPIDFKMLPDLSNKVVKKLAKIVIVGVHIWLFLSFISFSPSKGSKIKISRKKIIDAVWKQKGGIS